jgi:hypothetical protein
VYVEDREGTHRPEYFFSTDPQMSARQIVEAYTLRWSIEVTFEEIRAHLGFNTTRHWTKTAVQRVKPWLMTLFTVVTLIRIEHLRHRPLRIPSWPWYSKDEPTFADALQAVCHQIWLESVFTHPVLAPGLQKLSPQPPKNLLHWLTQAG